MASFSRSSIQTTTQNSSTFQVLHRLSSGHSRAAFRRTLWSRQWYRGTTIGTSSDLISLQYEIFRYFFLLDFTSSCSSNSLLYYLSICCSHKVSECIICYLVSIDLNITCGTCHLWALWLIFRLIFRNLLHVYNLFTININHYFKLIIFSVDWSPLLVKRV